MLKQGAYDVLIKLALAFWKDSHVPDLISNSTLIVRSDDTTFGLVGYLLGWVVCGYVTICFLSLQPTFAFQVGKQDL